MNKNNKQEGRVDPSKVEWQSKETFEKGKGSIGVVDL